MPGKPLNAAAQRKFVDGHPLRHWIEELRRDYDDETTSRAIKAIAEFGTDAKAAVPDLLELLRRNSLHASGIASALGSIGHATTAAVEMLTEMLDPKHGASRADAAQSLAAFGPAAASAADGLAALLECDDREGTALHALAALGQIGPNAVRVAPLVMKRLRRCLNSLDRSLREHREIESYCAMSVQALWGMQIRKAIPLIRDYFAASIGSHGLGMAANALRSLGVPAAEVVEMLAAELSARDAYRRREAASALTLFGSEARAAIPALTRALKDRSDSVRRAAERTLAAIPSRNAGSGREPPADSEPESDRLRYWIGELRRRRAENEPAGDAVEAIAAFGPAAKEAVPDIVELIRRSPNSAFHCAPALRVIGEGTAAAVEALTAELNSRDRAGHWIAARALRAFRTDAAPAVDGLAALLSRFDPMMTGAIAARTLAEIGPAARRAGPRLMECLARQLRRLDRATARGDFGKAEAIEIECEAHLRAVGDLRVTEAIPLVLDFFNLTFSLPIAATTLRKLGMPPSEIVTMLIAELSDSDPDVRCAAAAGLIELRTDAEAAIPDLKRALRDRSSRVREAAAEALTNIPTRSPALSGAGGEAPTGLEPMLPKRRKRGK